MNNQDAVIAMLALLALVTLSVGFVYLMVLALSRMM